MKQCTKCGATKPLDDFPLDRRTEGKRASQCRPCKNSRIKAWRDNNVDRERRADRERYANAPSRHAAHISRKYGISAEEFVAMLADQNGRCAICKGEPDGKRLCVDHDHTTGRVRGLLCVECNFVLGYVKDRPSVLRSAADYLSQEGVFA